MTAMATQVNIVPHTHWDREWYKPFPVFRMQLVELLDLLLDALEADADFTHFQLDGQMAVIDDYLEIRPERREQLQALGRAGRITVGPWYTLPDEFLVSGETHVRNLALGMDAAEEFGGPMMVGYLPDMFGHIAQMPQLLRGFGFDDAVVWRGVPGSIGAAAFDWEGPDGSTVRAEYLPGGYGNGARLPDRGEDLVTQVDAFLRAHEGLVADPVLWMNGTDHQLPRSDLSRIVAEANEAGDRFRFTITNLADHLAAGERDGLPRWRGEMRSGAGSNLLMGTASTRVDVKQAAARAERNLERVAEPLAALWFPAEDHPDPFFAHAWRDVIRNAAHDSICGCSADEVNDAVLHRYAESTRIAESITERAGIRALAAVGEPTIVLNPTSRDRGATVTAVLPGDIPPPDTQQIEVRPARHRAHTIGSAAAPDVIARAVLEDPKVTGFEFMRADDGAAIAVLSTGTGPRDVDETALRTQLADFARDRSIDAVHVEYQRVEATQEVLLRSDTVPGFGWRGLSPADLGDHAVRTEGIGLTNGLVSIEVDQANGTFSIDGVPGFGCLVDGGDAGDTYNWSPPAHDLLVDEPHAIDVQIREGGPIRGRIDIERRYLVPELGDEERRRGEAELRVRTTIELHACEDLVRVRIELDNRSRDHRLRIHLPLPERTDRSLAECAFGAVTRGLEGDGGPHEIPIPTFPSRRFVRAGGLTVLHEGLCEYELVDVDEDGSSAGELAVTLLRSVGVISQGPMAMRALPAGPSTPVPAAQLLGEHRFDLVLHVGDRDPWALADEAFTPMPVVRRIGGGFADPERVGRHLQVDGAEVTALRRRPDGVMELRVVNPTNQPTMVTIADGDGDPVRAVPTDLRGRDEGERVDGRVELAPHRIATFRLDL